MNCILGVSMEHWILDSTALTVETRDGLETRSDAHTQHISSSGDTEGVCVCVCLQPSEELSELSLRVAEISREQRSRGGAALLANGTRECGRPGSSRGVSSTFHWAFGQ